MVDSGLRATGGKEVMVFSEAATGELLVLWWVASHPCLCQCHG